MESLIHGEPVTVKAKDDDKKVEVEIASQLDAEDLDALADEAREAAEDKESEDDLEDEDEDEEDVELESEEEDDDLDEEVNEEE